MVRKQGQRAAHIMHAAGRQVELALVTPGNTGGTVACLTPATNRRRVVHVGLREVTTHYDTDREYYSVRVHHTRTSRLSWRHVANTAPLRQGSQSESTACTSTYVPVLARQLLAIGRPTSPECSLLGLFSGQSDEALSVLSPRAVGPWLHAQHFWLEALH